MRSTSDKMLQQGMIQKLLQEIQSSGSSRKKSAFSGFKKGNTFLFLDNRLFPSKRKGIPKMGLVFSSPS